MNRYAQLNNNLDALQLAWMKEILNSVIDRNTGNSDYSLQDALLDLTDAEIAFRDDSAKRIISVSHFPFNKTLRDFDFGFQAGINKEKILDLVSLRFLDKKENIVFMGSPGVGKTHLATAIGIEAASQRQHIFHKLRRADGEVQDRRKGRTGQSRSSSIA